MKGERRKPVTITVIEAEPVLTIASQDLEHLAANRGLIVRRALLASVIRGFLPVPFLDDVLAGRAAAGLYQKLASSRQVDLLSGAAPVLAEGGSVGILAKLTFPAAALVLAKFAGRKFAALLAAGRSAEDMARTFRTATLFDHYCVKLHVGGPISPVLAKRLRLCLLADSPGWSMRAWTDAFGEGGRILARSLLEAPAWVSQRFAALAERFVRSGGNPDLADALPDEKPGENTWLDRAAQAVEEALARPGNDHLAQLIEDFEARWKTDGG